MQKPEIEMKDNNEISGNITFRDTAHFYSVVHWLNGNFGSGGKNWTIKGKVLKHLRNGEQPTKKICILHKDADPSVISYLAML